MQARSLNRPSGEPGQPSEPLACGEELLAPGPAGAGGRRSRHSAGLGDQATGIARLRVRMAVLDDPWLAETEDRRPALQVLGEGSEQR